MLNTVKVIVNKHEEAIIYLTGAESIRKEVEDMVKETKVKVVFW